MGSDSSSGRVRVRGTRHAAAVFVDAQGAGRAQPTCSPPSPRTSCRDCVVDGEPREWGARSRVPDPDHVFKSVGRVVLVQALGMGRHGVARRCESTSVESALQPPHVDRYSRRAASQTWGGGASTHRSPTWECCSTRSCTRSCTCTTGARCGSNPCGTRSRSSKSRNTAP